MTALPSNPRRDGRQPNQLRPIHTQPGFTKPSPGSVLISAGETVVLCTASVDEKLPPWMPVTSEGGWVTAEYNMLPGSTSPRKSRDRGKVDGRTTEIQRLIGRSLRAAVNLKALGRRQITIDCDVLQADGGTRTLSITGGYLALCLALRTLPVDAAQVIRTPVAAVSVGIVDGELLTDLDYSEDHRAEVDTNLVMTGLGEFVEIQGTAEGKPFTEDQLARMIALGKAGIKELLAVQQRVLSE